MSNFPRLYTLFIIILACISIILGTIGFSYRTDGTMTIFKHIDSFYQSLQLFTLGAPVGTVAVNNWPLNIARFTSSLTTFGTVFGIVWILLRSFTTSIKYRMSRHKVIILGLEGYGRRVAEELRAIKTGVLAVDSSSSNMLESFCDRLGIVLVRGEADSRRLLKRLLSTGAEQVMIMTHSDSTNIRIGSMLKELLQDSNKRKNTKITIMLKDYALSSQITRDPSFLKGDKNVELRILNPSSNCLKSLLQTNPLNAYAEIRNQKRITTVCVGFSDTTLALLRHLASIEIRDDLEKPDVAVVCPNVEEVRARTCFLLPGIEDFIELQFIELPNISQFGSWLLGNDDNPLFKKPVTAVFAFNDEPQTGLSQALSIRDIMKTHRFWSAPIFVNVLSSVGYESMALDVHETASFDKVIKPFGPYDQANVLNELDALDTLAKHIHDTYCGNIDSDTIDSWTELPETFRNANRRAAGHMLVKLWRGNNMILDSGWTVAEGVDLEPYVGDLARLEHESWSADRILDGWQYGKSRDDYSLRHPCLVPYEDLTEEMQDLDRQQVRFLNDKVLKKGQTNPAIRLDIRIGLGGYNQISPDQTQRIRLALSEQILPKLFAQYPDAFFSIVSPLAPGSDLILTRQALASLTLKDKPHRMLTLNSLPWRAVAEDFSQWWSKHPTESNGFLGAYESTHKIHQWDDFVKAYLDVVSAVSERRAPWPGVQKPQTNLHDWIIPLTPPGIELDDFLEKNDLRIESYMRASAYLVAKTDVLILVYDGRKAKGPGGTSDMLDWRTEKKPIPETVLDVCGDLRGIGRPVVCINPTDGQVTWITT